MNPPRPCSKSRVRENVSTALRYLDTHASEISRASRELSGDVGRLDAYIRRARFSCRTWSGVTKQPVLFRTSSQIKDRMTRNGSSRQPCMTSHHHPCRTRDRLHIATPRKHPRSTPLGRGYPLLHPPTAVNSTSSKKCPPYRGIGQKRTHAAQPSRRFGGRPFTWPQPGFSPPRSCVARSSLRDQQGPRDRTTRPP